jgi:HTH-type transcriptional regulator, transcriptional repressor of NAD biosynthesis genes
MTTGLLLGKFLPPHLGHQYLVDFAQNYADNLIILVCSIKSEPIPGELRYKWMKEMCPNAIVIHITEELPQEPSEHPCFWELWEDAIKTKLGNITIDYVFASENYGFKLAEILKAQYVPVDHARELIPISGTMIRENPIKYWEYIPRAVKPYYVKRVCIFGPESTGKSTLTKDLAFFYNTVGVQEYARGLLNFSNGKCVYDDMEKIVKGHIASEDALAKNANRIMFSDTDALTTTIWSHILYGKCPDYITQKAIEQNYDLYFLTDIDIPWENDNQRYFPERKDREHFMSKCKEALEKHNRKYYVLSGDRSSRLTQACEIIKKEI